jgi:hypothetical protein
MHKNMDLCALMELELLNEMEIKYYPAMINLTVLYERMGRSEDAEALAYKLSTYMKEQELKVPLVKFNTAWYMGKKTDFHSINEGLGIVKSLNKSDATKYKTYKDQLKSRYKSFSLMKIGLMGKSGYIEGWSLFWGVLLFLFFSVPMSAVSYIIYNYIVDEYFGPDWAMVALLILLFILFSTVFFIFVWGIPVSFGGWFLLVVYDIIYVVFSALMINVFE